MNKFINEWNMWDGDRRSSRPRQTRMIDVADKMRREEMLARKERYNNDVEYHEHIKRLENELRITDDPQHAEYLERRINKLKSLVEGVKLSRTSRVINEMASMKYSYNDVLKYVIENITDMEHEIDLALISMDEWRCPLNRARCGEEIEDAIINAILDYEIDNDDRFEEEEVLNDILSNKDIEDILFDALNYKDKKLSESVRPMKRVNKNKMNRKGVIWKYYE